MGIIWLDFTVFVLKGKGKGQRYDSLMPPTLQDGTLLILLVPLLRNEGNTDSRQFCDYRCWNSTRHSRRRRGDAIRLALVVAGALLHCDELRK